MRLISEADYQRYFNKNHFEKDEDLESNMRMTLLKDKK